MFRYSLNFYLVGTKPQKDVKLYVRSAGVTYTINTGIKTIKTDWSVKKQRLTGGLYMNEYNKDLTEMTANYDKQIYDVQKDAARSGYEITFSAAMEKIINRPAEINDYDAVIDGFTKYLDSRKHVAKNTATARKTALNHIRKYLSMQTEYNVAEFIKYLEKQNLAVSTVYNFVSVFKSLCKYLVSIKAINEYNTQYLAAPSKSNQNKTKISMTSADIEKLRSLSDDNLTPNEIFAKNVFLLQCVTSQRISDIINLRKNDICKIADGSAVWILTQKKTKQSVEIHLTDDAFRIIERYNYNFNRITLTTINRRIKAVCKKAGIDELVKIEVPTFNGVKTVYKHKYELTHTHTARATFITTALNKEIPTAVIRSYTGHTNDKILNRYNTGYNMTVKRNAFDTLYTADETDAALNAWINGKTETRKQINL